MENRPGSLRSPMYALIETGGKQYRVAPGETIRVEKLTGAKGEGVSFDRILLVGGDGPIQIGTPYLASFKVEGEVISQFRDKKIIIYKYKRRKGYDKKQGHRQSLTAVKITNITSLPQAGEG